MKLTDEQIKVAVIAARRAWYRDESIQDTGHPSNMGDWGRAILAALATIQDAPKTEVPQDLVEKMCAAWYEDRNLVVCNSPSNIRAMTAALRAALEDERVLGDPVGIDVRDALPLRVSDGDKPPVQRSYDWFEVVNIVGNFLANRRARLLKTKTPEETVTINALDAVTFQVYRGAEFMHAFTVRIHAEIYRLGLIAKMKAEQEVQS